MRSLVCPLRQASMVALCSLIPSGRFSWITTGRGLSRFTRRPGRGCGVVGQGAGKLLNDLQRASPFVASRPSIVHYGDDLLTWRMSLLANDETSWPRSRHHTFRLLKPHDDAANNLTVVFKAPSRNFWPAHYCTERLHPFCSPAWSHARLADSSMALLHASQASKEGPLSEEH